MLTSIISKTCLVTVSKQEHHVSRILSSWLDYLVINRWQPYGPFVVFLSAEYPFYLLIHAKDLNYDIFHDHTARAGTGCHLNASTSTVPYKEVFKILYLLQELFTVKPLSIVPG
jgi:hypothetical protein